jgi:hypothetical protein
MSCNINTLHERGQNEWEVKKREEWARKEREREVSTIVVSNNAKKMMFREIFNNKSVNMTTHTTL